MTEQKFVAQSIPVPSLPKSSPRSATANKKRSPRSALSMGSDKACEVCGDTGDADKMLLCDSCDGGWHIFCVSPSLPEIPDRERWYCRVCEKTCGNNTAIHPTLICGEYDAVMFVCELFVLLFHNVGYVPATAGT